MPNTEAASQVKSVVPADSTASRKLARSVALIGLLPLGMGIIGRQMGWFHAELAGGLGSIAVACFAGLVPGTVLERVSPPPSCPDGIDNTLWAWLVGKTDVGFWIGSAERGLVLAALWMQAPTLIVGWLAFKLASKWEAWKNVIQVPPKLDDGTRPNDWLVARHELGSWLLNRFWLGTLVNLLAGLGAAYLGSLVGAIPPR